MQLHTFLNKVKIALQNKSLVQFFETNAQAFEYSLANKNFICANYSHNAAKQYAQLTGLSVYEVLSLQEQLPEDYRSLVVLHRNIDQIQAEAPLHA